MGYWEFKEQLVGLLWFIQQISCSHSVTEHQVLCLPSSEIILEVSRGIEIQAKWESGTAVPSTTATFSMTFFFFFQRRVQVSRRKCCFPCKRNDSAHQRQTDRKTDNMGGIRCVSFGWQRLEHFSVLNQSNFCQFETNTMSWHWWAVYCGSQGVSSSFLAPDFQVNYLSIPLKIQPLFSCPRQLFFLFLSQIYPKKKGQRINLSLLLLSSSGVGLQLQILRTGVGIEANSPAFFSAISNNYSLEYQDHLLQSVS